MDLQELLRNIESPEQLQKISAKLAKFGRPPSGMPGMPQDTKAPNPMGVAVTPPAIPGGGVPPVPNIGSILGGFR